MRKILSVLLISIFMLSSYAAPYTYDDLISIMNVSNIELLMDDEVIKSATYDLNEAKGSYSPTIDLTLSGTYMVNPPSISRESLDSIMDQVLNKENPFASSMEGMFNDFDKLQIIDKPFMYMAQLNLTQPIFTWGKVTNVVKLYEKLLEIRKIEREDKAESLSVELEGYLGGIYYAESILEKLRLASEDAKELISIAESGYENGVMLLSDLNEARLSSSELDMALTEVEAQLAELRENVRKTVGSGISDDEYEFTPDEERYYAVSEMDRDELRLRAVSNSNSNILMASMAVEAAELGKDIASGNMYGKPDIALQVGLGYTGFLGNNWDSSGDYSLNLTLGLKTTLWDGGKILNDVKRAESQISTSSLTLENAKSQLSVALEDSFRTMDLAKSRISYYQTKSEVLNDDLRLIETQNASGYASESDILEKKIEIYQNEINLLTEKGNLMQGALAVEYIAGLR